MRLFKAANGVIFVKESLEKAFNSLADNSPLKKSIKKAMKDLNNNVFCGERIQKKLIPKEYIKNYKIDNLWWYPLANAWRLVYVKKHHENHIFQDVEEFLEHPEVLNKPHLLRGGKTQRLLDSVVTPSNIDMSRTLHIYHLLRWVAYFWVLEHARKSKLYNDVHYLKESDYFYDILAVIIDYSDHKGYERRFGYT